MPHLPRYLAVLLLLASCGTPSREPDTTRAPETWSRRAWRSPARPLASVAHGGQRLRAWARTDFDESAADQVRADAVRADAVRADAEPVASAPEESGSGEPSAPEVVRSAPESEPAGEAPAPLEISVLAEEPPAIAAPAPETRPAPTQAPAAPAPARVDPAQLIDQRASIVLMWYFQRDDDPSSLGRSELQEAFSQYDWNKNGLVIELEFDATTGVSAPFGREPQGDARALMGDVRPLDALLAAVDSDGDNAFSLSELLAFHDRHFASEPN